MLIAWIAPLPQLQSQLFNDEMAHYMGCALKCFSKTKVRRIWNTPGKLLIVVEAGWWVHGWSEVHYIILHFVYVLNFSVIKCKNKIATENHSWNGRVKTSENVIPTEAMRAMVKLSKSTFKNSIN